MSESKFPFSLMEDEEVLMDLRPHPLSMTGLMLFWLFIGALGVVFIIYYQDIQALVSGGVSWNFPGKRLVTRHAYNLAWTLSLLVPLLIMAIFRINFGYVLTLLGLVVANVLLQWKVAPMLGSASHPHLENFLLILVGVAGVAGVELFRRGHRYYLTSHRMVARFGTLRMSERSTLYSKVDDLMLQQSLLGKIFNFGTVIPLTSTGLGMGQDMAIAGAGAGASKAGAGVSLFAAGAKAKNVPRELSFYVLYRVPDPTSARDLIMEEMHDRERRS